MVKGFTFEYGSVEFLDFVRTNKLVVQKLLRSQDLRMFLANDSYPKRITLKLANTQPDLWEIYTCKFKLDDNVTIEATTLILDEAPSENITTLQKVRVSELTLDILINVFFCKLP